MSLSKEWLNRITHWNNALWQICYEPLQTLELSGFVTRKQLTAEQALMHKFHSMPLGTAWGAKWEYGWFQCEFSLPDRAAGRRIVLYMNPAAKSPEDGECLVWVNGKVAGAFGWAKRELTLTRNGIPGAKYAILAEAYAGHGPFGTHDVPVMGGGPVRYGHPPFPEIGNTQCVVGSTSFGIWREQAYQLALDFTTLFELRNRLDHASLRVSEIDQGLKDVTLLIDLELPEPEMLETINFGRERLHALLASINGSTAPTLFAFGHAHIDVAWLWPWAETDRKIARTVSNQLALMEEYPDYRFLQSQPQLYLMLKSHYPELYERLKQAVLTGKVIADGAMWVEADTNITGGESLIRQIMYAKQFFKQEFNLNMEVMWLPDVFGYTGSLPQILLQSGCTSFATQKIAWIYHGGDPFPYTTFLWEGIDGSVIPTHIFSDYNSETRPSSLLDRWEGRLQKDGIRSMLLPFGWGDGGGGPTRDHLEFLARAKDLEGLPRVRLSSPSKFFADLKQQGLPKERYVGELYFQAHRGTFTTQARTKKLNRQSEIALREAELWGSIAYILNGYRFTSIELKPSWLKLLLNQFHDILPGSSIHRVYEEAEAAFSQVISSTKTSTRSSQISLIPTKTPGFFTIFNSLSWERKALIETSQGVFEVIVPACGWTTVNEGTSQPKSFQNGRVKTTRTSLENEFLTATFNDKGELVSLLDKETHMELLTGPGNRFCLYKDIPARFDAWDIDSMTEALLMTTDEPVSLEVLAAEPYIGKLKLSRKLHNSTISQVISLESGKRVIKFETAVDWQESHKLLKVAFPVNFHANEAIHEIQFGHIRRPNHRSRPFDADRFEVCNHKWSALAEENRGIAILNDSKYGINVLGNIMNLTLLKSALAPDPLADKGHQTFTYALYSWNGSFGESEVVKEAYELNNPISQLPGAAGEVSCFKLDVSNVILETVKLAEDGSGDLILRLYECKRNHTRCSLVTTLPVQDATQTDMLERFQSTCDITQGKIELEFHPFEIKTLRLSMVNQEHE
ncbi:MAG: alpha-mannosidase [Anaerolineales bacterium]|nr:alpha-mannosidase [Anaerolineae bacterium]PWB50953.1 MAG: alpha-mannosidase [Anaerolineales bacterium]